MKKQILNATKALFLFMPYTVFPRWMEIGYGIMAWIGTFFIMYVLISKAL